MVLECNSQRNHYDEMIMELFPSATDASCTSRSPVVVLRQMRAYTVPHSAFLQSLRYLLYWEHDATYSKTTKIIWPESESGWMSHKIFKIIIFNHHHLKKYMLKPYSKLWLAFTLAQNYNTSCRCIDGMSKVNIYFCNQNQFSNWLSFLFLTKNSCTYTCIKYTPNVSIEY